MTCVGLAPLLTRPDPCLFTPQNSRPCLHAPAVSEAAIRLLVSDTMRVRMHLGLFDNITASSAPYLSY